ncbi:MAG: aldehyde dehydrogenase family protein [Gammaproteobacteria bacterium]
MNSSITDHVSATVSHLRGVFNAGKTQPLDYRLEQLAGIQRFLTECQADIYAALQSDLRKPQQEAFTADIAFVLTEIKLTRKKLASWIKPVRVASPLWAQPGKSYIYHEPLGVTLVIAPWNFPIQLAIVPLIGAIAAGNCAILKPSELAPATSKVLATLLPKYVDPDCLQVIEGDAAVATALLAEKFDYIFYTGNGTVGRIVMEAAAKHLTPVTLELGGKSPCIVDQNCDLEVAARRILFGKFYNAGQVCVAPDYVLVHEAVEETLLACMKKTLQDFYGDDPRNSPDYGRIVNDRHFQRIMQLLPGSGEIFVGGNADAQERYIAPTILRHVPIDSPVMQEEIFGPILPIFTVKNIDEAINFVNVRPKPLALYLFTKDQNVQNQVLDKTSSGTVAMNNTIMQFIASPLPTGGVGASGMGSYHGQASFETFSHRKFVLKQSMIIDPPLVYPPYTSGKLKWIKRLFLGFF